MRILLFGPNGGISLSTGGGAGFGLKMAAELVALGHSVDLAAYHALDLDSLDRMHGTQLAAAGDRVRLIRGGSLNRAFELYRGLPFKLSAYDGLLSPAFARWAEATVRRSEADAILFQDDIPQLLVDALAGRRVHLYVHYPFAGLRTDLIPPLREVLTRVEWANVRMLRALYAGLLVPDGGAVARTVWANSTITSRVVAAVWPKARPRYVPPTIVDPPAASTGVERDPSSVVALGTIQKAKNYPTLLRAFARAARNRPEARLSILGHVRDVAHLAELRRLARRLGVNDRVELRTDLSRPELDRRLATASVMVHPAMFEPFGLALLEGMAHGAVPVTPTSDYAGGWVDILDRGRFGVGFGDEAELAERLTDLLDPRADLTTPRARARERAASFSRTRLRQSLVELFP